MWKRQERKAQSSNELITVPKRRKKNPETLQSSDHHETTETEPDHDYLISTTFIFPRDPIFVCPSNSWCSLSGNQSSISETYLVLSRYIVNTSFLFLKSLSFSFAIFLCFICAILSIILFVAILYSLHDFDRIGHISVVCEILCTFRFQLHRSMDVFKNTGMYVVTVLVDVFGFVILFVVTIRIFDLTLFFISLYFLRCWIHSYSYSSRYVSEGYRYWTCKEGDRVWPPMAVPRRKNVPIQVGIFFFWKRGLTS